ncbi:Synaptosomal-associated protein 23 [Polyrhizophydium stewartii]|uniref:Synaptosomal-associated protein 23 n=1 Tax=Polyrhizophydium stewartii TaxID=2732419 RepID=A0ABR4N0V1_9FUNG|nr:hypothetical protein HK105_008126 [Polyrhizophydium stewartii]
MSAKNPFAKHDSIRRGGAQEDRQDDLDSLIAETLTVQEDSARTTDRALLAAQQAVQTGQQGLTQLSAQGEQLDAINRRMGDVHASIDQAKAKTDYLSKLTQSFLIPVFGSAPAATPATAPAPAAPAAVTSLAVPQNHISSRRSSSLLRAQPGAAGSASGTGAAAPGSRLVEGASAEQHAQSMRYEAQIDSGVSQISTAVSDLRGIALSMNQELDRQNDSIRRAQDQAATAGERVDNLNSKLGKILKK